MERAAHLPLDEFGRARLSPGRGSAASSTPRRLCRFSTPNPDLPEYTDLGIIELDPGVVTDPAMCHFGGPTGMREEPLASPEPLHLYGTGERTGFNRQTGTTLLPGRTGVGTSALHPNVVSGSYPIPVAPGAAPFGIDPECIPTETGG